MSEDKQPTAAEIALAALATRKAAEEPDPAVKGPTEEVPPSAADAAHAAISQLGAVIQQNAPASAVAVAPVAALTLEELEVEVAIRRAERKAVEDAEKLKRQGPGKTYHTRMQNSTFIVQKHDKEGKPLPGQTETLQFHGDSMYVENEDYVKQIDEACDVGGSPIYSKVVTEAQLRVDQEAFNEVRERAAAIAVQIGMAGGRA